ncbi:MAG: Rpn family recombination-promoting nuclease/putative transposase [Deltaproteobacteria bacterium]|nr:MAG: Rpn family recombination-promoting nuclease/putative transposase [Deltaproteobacteria bacterium]
MTDLLSPTVDFVFKALFGQEHNKPLLLGLLNAILDRVEGERIVDLELLQPELGKIEPNDKEVKLDLLARDQTERIFHVEMQVQNHPFFLERVLYYWSRLFGRQLHGGQPYSKLHPVISIIFSDFVAIPELEDYHTCWMWTEVEHGTILSDHGQIHIIEFPKFHESWEEAHDALEQWVSFLKEADTMTFEELADWKDEKLIKAYEELERLSQDPKLRAYYDAQLREIRDYRTIMTGAIVEGWQKGHKQGLEAGLQEGRQEGLQEGRQGGLQEGRQEGLQEGRQEVHTKVVRKLQQQGYSLEEIANILEVSVEELQPKEPTSK